MLKTLKNSYYAMGASVTMGLLASANTAQAAGQGGGGAGGGGNNFSNIASNMTDSVSQLPGLLTALAYLFGLMLGVLGILKIKDHVENPGQNPLKDGAIRLAAGGALFALPIIFEAMTNTIGPDGANAITAEVNKANFNVK